MSKEQTNKKYRIWWGWALQVFAVLLILVSLLCTAIGFAITDRFLLLAVFSIIGFIIFLIAADYFQMGRAMRVRVAEGVFKKEDPYVLYLRSFDSELSTSQVPPITTETLMMFFSGSEEEKLARAMGVIGTGVTVGRPSEECTPLGFHRLYFPEKDWLTSVKDLMSNAALVLIRVGKTGGVLSELEIARKSVRPERLVLMIPRDSDLIHKTRQTDDDDSKMSSGCSPELQVCQELRIPFLRGVHGYQQFQYSFAGIIYFDSDWVAYQRLLKGTMTDSFIHAVDRAFKPVYKQLGVRRRLRLYHVWVVINSIVLSLFVGGFVMIIVLAFRSFK